ncbi:fluoride efflux transporter FluC [Kurthia sibirica]|uniref:Fluoride-specific ion channel FluC n=1 Tax=Kurthia sibirica TaxID=202750 RepID=A0A2U3AK77_9BACL|nr:CrcB family protein [Kurthia sibirica]PWI24925.1 protein CrcB [Kurthia sibirica]GEK33165.1 putative fluoride ion transporter CrcB [Kurthia sibirica]
MISTFAIVFLGGFIGTFLRGMVMLYTTTWLSLWIVNVIGSFMIGLLQGYYRTRQDKKMSLFLLVGLLGSFTTFSAFCTQWLQLLERTPLMAAAYAVGMPLVCIALTSCGWLLATKGVLHKK